MSEGGGAEGVEGAGRGGGKEGVQGEGAGSRGQGGRGGWRLGGRDGREGTPGRRRNLPGRMGLSLRAHGFGACEIWQKFSSPCDAKETVSVAELKHRTKINIPCNKIAHNNFRYSMPEEYITIDAYSFYTNKEEFSIVGYNLQRH